MDEITESELYSDEGSGCGDNDKLYSDDFPIVYVRRIKKCSDKLSNQQKKSDRVYNSLQACVFCQKLFHHIVPHLKAKHSNEVKGLSSLDFNMLRLKGNDAHNQQVKLVEKGELILSRRPVESFKTADYGPCPHCSDWMLKTTFVRHQSKCKAPDLVQKLSNKEIILTSNIKSGHIEVGQVSELMLHEVFPTMTIDENTKIAQRDLIILGLGESWLRRSYSNKLKRANNTSSRMRLARRYLQILKGYEDELMIKRRRAVILCTIT
jgi:hypothetical protein